MPISIYLLGKEIPKFISDIPHRAVPLSLLITSIYTTTVSAFRVLRFPLIPNLTLLTSPTHLPLPNKTTQQNPLSKTLSLSPFLLIFTTTNGVAAATTFSPPPLPHPRRRHGFLPHLHHPKAHGLQEQPLLQLPGPARARFLPPLDSRPHQRLPLGGLRGGAAQLRRLGVLGDQPHRYRHAGGAGAGRVQSRQRRRHRENPRP